MADNIPPRPATDGAGRPELDFTFSNGLALKHLDAIFLDRREAMAASYTSLLRAKSAGAREIAAFGLAAQASNDEKLRAVFRRDANLVGAVVHQLKAPDAGIRMNCVRAYAALSSDEGVPAAVTGRAMSLLSKMLDEPRPRTAAASPPVGEALHVAMAYQQHAAAAMASTLHSEGALEKGGATFRHVDRLLELLAPPYEAATVEALASAVEAVGEAMRSERLRAHLLSRTQVCATLISLMREREGTRVAECAQRALLNASVSFLPVAIAMVRAPDTPVVTKRQLAQLLPQLLLHEEVAVGAWLRGAHETAALIISLVQAADDLLRAAGVSLLRLLGAQTIDACDRRVLAPALVRMLGEGVEVEACSDVLGHLLAPIAQAAHVLRAFIGLIKPGSTAGVAARRATINLMLAIALRQRDEATEAMASQPGMLSCIVGCVSVREVETAEPALRLIEQMMAASDQVCDKALQLSLPAGGVLAPTLSVLAHFAKARAEAELAHKIALDAGARPDGARAAYERVSSFCAVTACAARVLELAVPHASDEQLGRLCVELPRLLAPMMAEPQLELQAGAVRLFASLLRQPSSLFHLLGEGAANQRAALQERLRKSGAHGRAFGQDPSALDKPVGHLDAPGTVSLLMELPCVLCAAHNGLADYAREKRAETEAQAARTAAAQRRAASSAQRPATAAAAQLAGRTDANGAPRSASGLALARRPSAAQQKHLSRPSALRPLRDELGGAQTDARPWTAPAPNASMPPRLLAARAAGGGVSAVLPPMVPRVPSSNSDPPATVRNTSGRTNPFALSGSTGAGPLGGKGEPELPPIPERAIPAPIGDLSTAERRALAVQLIEDAAGAIATLSRHPLGRNALAVGFHVHLLLARIVRSVHSAAASAACMAALASLTQLEHGHRDLAASAELAESLTVAMARQSAIKTQAHAIEVVKNLAAHSEEAAVSLCGSAVLLVALMRLAASDVQLISAASIAVFASFMRVPLNTGLALEACGRSLIKVLVAAERSDSSRARRDAIYSVSRLLGGGGAEADREPLEMPPGRSQPHLSSILSAPDMHARKAVHQALKKLAVEAGVDQSSGLVEDVVEAYSELAMLHPVEQLMLANEAQHRADMQRGRADGVLDDLDQLQRDKARMAADLARALSAGLGGSADGGGGLNTVQLGSSLQPMPRAMRLALEEGEEEAQGEPASTGLTPQTRLAHFHEPKLVKAPSKASIAQAHAQIVRRALTRDIAQMVGRGGSRSNTHGPIGTLLKALESEDEHLRVRTCSALSRVFAFCSPPTPHLPGSPSPVCRLMPRLRWLTWYSQRRTQSGCWPQTLLSGWTTRSRCCR